MRGFEEADDNLDGLIPRFIKEAGFRSVSETEHFTTIFGPLSMIKAMKGV